MSAKGIESVLTRAMSDNKFADMLFTQPDQALAGFDLTAEEASTLKAMPRKTFEQFTKASPEERKSFATLWNHNETALIAD